MKTSIFPISALFCRKISGKSTCLRRLLTVFGWRNDGHEVGHWAFSFKQFCFYSTLSSDFLSFFFLAWKAKSLLWRCWFLCLTFNWDMSYDTSGDSYWFVQSSLQIFSTERFYCQNSIGCNNFLLCNIQKLLDMLIFSEIPTIAKKRFTIC